VSFPSMETAIQTVTEIVSAGIIPTTLEVMDKITVQAVEAFVKAGYPLDAEAVLLIEVDGPRAQTPLDVEKIRAVCRKNGSGDIRQARDESERQKLWEGRRGSYPAMARLAPNVLVEDGVVPRQLLPEAVKRIRAIAARENIRMGLIAHAGDGNLHPNIVFDERDPEETRRVKAAGYEMLKVCVDLGGSISGEHGIGIDKREAMRWLFPPDTLRLFRRIKNGFDPENLCNPDKLIPSIEDSPAGNSGDGGTMFIGEIRPAEVRQIQDILRAAGENNTPVFVRGAGTKKRLSNVNGPVVLMDGFKKILDHDRQNFTLTVEAGARLDDLRSVLEPAGQYLHLSGDGTLGGIIASRACSFPSLRDQLIGLQAVLSDGSVIDLGAKVMKNVAGYDAMKLFIGSWGTLGVITRVTLRLWPFASPAIQKAAQPPELPFLSPLQEKIKTIFDPPGILNPSVLKSAGHV
jgi:glycolate oxidase